MPAPVRPAGWLLCLLLLVPAPAAADDEFTLYELLEPGSSSFAIRFDVTTSRSGARFYLNPVRPGSVVRDERVIDRHTGQELDWELISGADAKIRGLLPDRVGDDGRYLKIALREPVPEGGEARLRIFKTYEDPASYTADGDEIVFERSLGIRANAVVLPAGYELVESSVPSIVSVLPGGRVKVSFLNDRDDALEARIVGRKLRGEGDPSGDSPPPETLSRASGAAIHAGQIR